MKRSTKPGTPDTPTPDQSEVARGTPPARTPEALPDTDVQPDQAPVRDTPDVARTSQAQGPR